MAECGPLDASSTSTFYAYASRRRSSYCDYILLHGCFRYALRDVYSPAESRGMASSASKVAILGCGASLKVDHVRSMADLDVRIHGHSYSQRRLQKTGSVAY